MIYTVRLRNQTENEPKATRLVEADHISKVKAHILAEFEIEKASTKECVELGAAGVKVEAIPE